MGQTRGPGWECLEGVRGWSSPIWDATNFPARDEADVAPSWLHPETSTEYTGWNIRVSSDVQKTMNQPAKKLRIIREELDPKHCTSN